MDVSHCDKSGDTAPCSNTATNDAECAWTIGQAGALEVSQCNKQNNSSNIAACLPPELLSMIFEWNAAADCQQEPGWRPSWVIVTYVCSHWRRAALGCPTLWSRIIVSSSLSMQWVAEMLSRSQLAPLVVVVPGFRHSDRKKVLTVLNDLHRVRELSIRVSQHDVSLEDVLMSLGRPAPMLEKFAMSADGFIYLSPVSYDRFCTLPHSLFCSDAPRLRSLHLEQCTPLSAIPPGLTVLKLKNFPKSARLSVSELLVMLDALPNLRTLVLVNADRRSLDGTPIRKPHLPQLRCLELGSNVATCIALLPCFEYLHIPSLTLSTFTPLTFRFSEFLVSIHRLISLLAKRTVRIRCLNMTQQSGERLRIECWPHAGPALRRPSDTASTTVDVVMRALRLVRSSGNNESEVVRTVLEALPLQLLESLYISYPGLPARMLRNVFGGLPVLRNMCVAHMDLEVIAALRSGRILLSEQSNDDCGDDDAGEPRAAPSLRMQGRLWFRALRSLTVHGWRSNAHERNVALFQDLADCVKERRMRGVAVRELHIVDSFVMSREDINWETIMDRLAEGVKFVSWHRQD